MKKAVLYVVGAVLLGVAIMATPRCFLSTTGEFPRFQASVTGLSASTKDSWQAVARNEQAAGVTPNYPQDALSVGLMSVASLVVAYVVFKQFKKRMV